jgi:hypothetical protein
MGIRASKKERQILESNFKMKEHKMENLDDDIEDAVNLIKAMDQDRDNINIGKPNNPRTKFPLQQLTQCGSIFSFRSHAGCICPKRRGRMGSFWKH